jgi:lon-related putative ATP-dependent protease
MIQPGCFHTANGGYLILDALRLLQQPMAWEGVKRTLRSGKVRIESLEQTLSLGSTITLEPEPIPIRVKVALLGDRQLYHLLAEADADFDELFKVQADFGEDMPAGESTQENYARLIAAFVQRQKLMPFDRGAVLRVIGESFRRAADQHKLSAEVHFVADLLREADYWAGAENRRVVSEADVAKAVQAKEYRSDRVRELLQEQIERGILVIETQGERVGQVNGLSVLQLGGFAFGRPSRITARVAPGDGEVVDIEREAELSGPLHSKGVLILSGYMKARYGSDLPLSLNASLVFEQSYGGIDGDSASSAELYALLSAIAEVPLRQNVAVTGAVSQRGEVLAIGGVNEKIEGFFDVCNANGWAGGESVLIPESNVVHLQLRDDVVEAVADGRFAVYVAATIDDGIGVLTGLEPGAQGSDGAFPEGTFNAKVAARLRAFADARRRFEHEKDA